MGDTIRTELRVGFSQIPSPGRPGLGMTFLVSGAGMTCLLRGLGMTFFKTLPLILALLLVSCLRLFL
jgi:hypothetical protein